MQRKGEHSSSDLLFGCSKKSMYKLGDQFAMYIPGEIAICYQGGGCLLQGRLGKPFSLHFATSLAGAKFTVQQAVKLPPWPMLMKY